MKKTKLMSLLACIAVLFGASACLNTESKGMEETNNFTAFMNLFEGSETVYTGISYKLTRYFDDNKATLEISGLKFPDGTTLPTVTLEDLKMSYNSSEWLIISGTNVQAKGVSGYVSNCIFDKINFEIHDNQMIISNQPINTPYYNITYTINSTYQVRSIPSAMLFKGTVTVTNPADNSVFTTEDPIFGINVDYDKKNGYILIQDAKFAQNMQAMNMKFKDLPFTVGGDGTVRMDVEKLIPYLVTSDNKENIYEGAPISDLKLAWNSASGMHLTFTCTLIRDIEKDGQQIHIEAPYNVSVDCMLKNPR